MKSKLVAALTVFGFCHSPVHAQVLPGDLLVSSWQFPPALVHYRPDGTLVQMASNGTGSHWTGAVILPDGNWLTHRSQKSAGVNIFDGVSGQEIATWDLTGISSGNGDVAIFSDGTIAIVDESDHEVWHYDLAGSVLGRWQTGGSNLLGIWIDEQDEVWTCDNNGTIRHTDDQGNLIKEFGTGGVALCDLLTAPDGSVFVLRGVEVHHYTPDGGFLGSFALPPGPGIGSHSIAISADETLWVSKESGPTMWNVDQTGTVLSSFPVGITLDQVFMTVLVPTGESIGVNYCGPANTNSTGQSALISAFGSDVAAKNKLALTATQLPPNQFGYFLNSDVQGFTPFPPGSQGNLCLGGGIGRHAKQIAKSGNLGELSIDVDLTALPRPSGPHSVLAGETWNFQCWFRDNNGGSTSNFTDGISVTFK